jgi:hypothetical protein
LIPGGGLRGEVASRPGPLAGAEGLGVS